MPKENRKFYFLLKAVDYLLRGKIYTFDLEIFCELNIPRVRQLV